MNEWSRAPALLYGTANREDAGDPIPGLLKMDCEEWLKSGADGGDVGEIGEVLGDNPRLPIELCKLLTLPLPLLLPPPLLLFPPLLPMPPLSLAVIL